MAVTVKQAVADFIDFTAGRGLAERYVSKQRGRLDGRNGFMQACQKIKGNSPTMGQVDYQCVTEYFKMATTSPGDRNNKLSALRQFLNWAERRKLLRPGFTAEDLLTGYTSRKVVRAPKLYVPADRFGEMLDLAGEHHPRDRALVALILFTLCRQSEITPMRLKDLDLLQTRTLQVYREKTKRHTPTGVTPELADEMAGWLDWYAAHTGYASAAELVAAHPDWYLVPPGQHGWRWRDLNPVKPMTAAERIMQRALTGMGYPEITGEGCHTGRRSGARAMFLYLRDSIGFDGALIRVQTMLDHETPQMTLKYIGMDQEREELNDWLKSNSMYGTPPKGGAKVLPFRRSA